MADELSKHDALMQAVENNDIQQVKRVLREGCDVNGVDVVGKWPGTSPVALAAELGHADIVLVLLDAGARDYEVASLAVGHRHSEVVRAWLDAGGNPDLPVNRHGLTPLMHAARAGNLEIVKLLVEAGADINLRDEEGGTALSIAGEEGNLEVYEYLRERASEETRREASFGRDPTKRY